MWTSVSPCLHVPELRGRALGGHLVEDHGGALVVVRVVLQDAQALDLDVAAQVQVESKN